MQKSKKFPHIYQNILKNGDISYHIGLKIQHQKTTLRVGKKSDGMTVTKAEKIRIAKVREIEDGKIIKTKIVSFGEIATQYFTHSQIFNKSYNKQLLKYNKHLEFLANKRAINLSIKQIEKMQSEKMQTLKQSSINSITTLANTILNFGVKNDLIPYNPLKGKIKKLKADDKRIRYLSKIEIKKLKADVKDNPILKHYVAFALGTGGRVKAILSIQKKDIDYQNKLLHLKDLKGSSTYPIFLNSELMKICEDLKELNPNDFIIPISYQNLRNKMLPFLEQFNKGLEKNDTKNRVVLHTLRHTFASYLAIKNTPIQLIQKLMNHTDIKTTLRYAHLSPEKGKNELMSLYE